MYICMYGSYSYVFLINRSQFPDYDIEVVNAGVNSDRIACMRTRLEEDVLSLKPDAVMLFWDSDISDQSVEVLDRTETKLKYEEDLRAVLQRLKSNCSHISVSGIHISTHTYTHIHTYIHLHIHTYIHLLLSVHAYLRKIYTYSFIYTCTYIRAYIHTYTP